MAIIHRDPLEELTHWEPFRGIERLQQEMNHLFDRFLPSSNSELRVFNFIPLVEIEEADEVVHLKLEIPGMQAKDLDVQVAEASILIKGERKSESKTEEKGMVRSELQYGKFERKIPLPAHIQIDKVQAEYKNGILSLTMPKVESEQHKSVKIDIKEVS